MARLIFVIGFVAIALSYFCANVVLAACTVDVANTRKIQDQISTECVWNAPSNAYIIIKEVTWSIAWNESAVCVCVSLVCQLNRTRQYRAVPPQTKFRYNRTQEHSGTRSNSGLF